MSARIDSIVGSYLETLGSVAGLGGFAGLGSSDLLTKGRTSHPGTSSSKIRRKDILCYIMKVSEEYQKFAQLQR
jgi:hypothetical protein